MSEPLKNSISFYQQVQYLKDKNILIPRIYYWAFISQPAFPNPIPFQKNRQLFTQIYMLKLMYPSPEDWNTCFLMPLNKLMSDYRHCIKETHIGFPKTWHSILAV